MISDNCARAFLLRKSLLVHAILPRHIGRVVQGPPKVIFKEEASQYKQFTRSQIDVKRGSRNQTWKKFYQCNDIWSVYNILHISKQRNCSQSQILNIDQKFFYCYQIVMCQTSVLTSIAHFSGINQRNALIIGTSLGIGLEMDQKGIPPMLIQRRFA